MKNSMTKYIIKRILLMILTFLVISTMCFVLIKLLPLPAIKEQGRDAALILARREALGYGKLPICVAKTQYSFSDDMTKLGAPTGFTVTVRNVKVSAGAGFVVVLTHYYLHLNLGGMFYRRHSVYGMLISSLTGNRIRGIPI